MIQAAMCLFLPAPSWTWFRGWLVFVVVVVTSTVITLYLRRVNPDVIAARVRPIAAVRDGTVGGEWLLRRLLYLLLLRE